MAVDLKAEEITEIIRKQLSGLDRGIDVSEVGTVTSVGQLPFDSGPEVRYPVRTTVPNPDNLLKPHMAAYARVLTEPTSAMERLLRGPLRWARLFWWKIWP